MIALFGELLLLIALVCSFAQSILPFWGYYRRNPYLLSFARPSALGQFIFIGSAYLLLTIAFGINDFSIAYVAANSHPTLPLMYRLTAVWGAHEGSILLWILILNIWTIVCSFMQKKDAAQALTLATLGVISFCFLLFLLLTSNPFLPTLTPQPGQDLNPLLQDFGFIIHPPMLYMGYVGFSVAFAITLSALLRGELDALWAQRTRQFATAAWCFLTLGITLGSWWAYRVLGWGGFWFWDPVENASLLPWLSGTALLHVLILVEKRDIAKGWAALLAIISFALSLLGTFLVRSGVLISAHTFANDPARGVFLLILLAILITAAIIIYVLRMPRLAATPSPLNWLSREMALLFNSAFLFIAMGTVLLGTLYPLILDALHLGAISVGAPYFNKVMTPLVFITMSWMGLAPLCNWQQEEHSKKAFVLLIIKNIIISLFAAVLLLLCFTGHLDIKALLTLTLSCWVILSIIGSLRFISGMSVAHLGFAILIIGIMLSSILNVERDVRLQPGNAAQVGPYQFFFIDTEVADGSNYHGIRAIFDVVKNNRHITYMFPEKRIYTVRGMIMSKVDIQPGIFRDLYIALGEPLNATDWSVRIYYKPFVRFIWAGGMIMMLGGILALIQRKQKNREKYAA